MDQALRGQPVAVAGVGAPAAQVLRQGDGELVLHGHEGFWMGMDTFRDWTELNGLWDGGNAAWKVWND